MSINNTIFHIFTSTEQPFFYIFQYMCYGGRSQRSLPFTTDAQNGTLGEEGFYTHSSTTSSHEKTSI